MRTIYLNRYEDELCFVYYKNGKKAFKKQVRPLFKEDPTAKKGYEFEVVLPPEIEMVSSSWIEGFCDGHRSYTGNVNTTKYRVHLRSENPKLQEIINKIINFLK